MIGLLPFVYVHVEITIRGGRCPDFARWSPKSGLFQARSPKWSPILYHLKSGAHLWSLANINSTWIKSSLPFCGFQTDLQSHKIKVRDGTAKNETEKRKKPRKCIWNTWVIFLIDLQTLFWSLSCYPIRCSLKAVKMRCVVWIEEIPFSTKTIHRSVFTKIPKFALKL